MFCICDKDGYLVKLNDSFTKTLGYTEDEMLHQQFMNFLHPDDVDRTVAELDKLNSGVPTIHFENRYLTKDGSYKLLAWRSSPQSSGYIYAVARDITAQKQKQVETKSAIINAQDAERRRIAQEIHDGICQSLVAIQLNFHTLEPDDERKKAYYDTASKLIKNSIQEMRTYAHSLSPPELVGRTIMSVVKDLAKRTSILAQVNIDFDCQVQESMEIPENLKLHIYRIIQEFLNNSIKHSGCDNILIRCAPRDEAIELHLTDDGKGLSLNLDDAMQIGTGFTNMFARLELIRGSFDLTSNNDQGLELSMVIPIT